VKEESIPLFKVTAALTLGMIAFGFAPILVKFGTDYSAIKIASVRTVFGYLLLLPAWWMYRKKTEYKKEKENEQKGSFRLKMIAGLFLGTHFLCWIGSLYYTSVASASVLVTVHPVILIVAERAIFKKQFTILAWTGVFVAFAGSIMLGFTDRVASDDFSNPLLGNALAFLAAIIFAVYFMIGRKIRQQSSWINYVTPVYGFAAVACVIAFLLFELPFSFSEIDSLLLLIGLGLALGPQILGHGSLNYAVKYISPTILSTLILTEPAAASVLAYFFFGEIPPLASVFAMVIIITGVFVTWKKKSSKNY